MSGDAVPTEPQEQAPLITEGDATPPPDEVPDLMFMARSGTLRSSKSSASADWRLALRNDNAEPYEGGFDNAVFGGIVDNTIWGGALSEAEAAQASVSFQPAIEERRNNSHRPLHVVAFVNSGSGGQIGAAIMKTFQGLFVTRQSSSAGSGFTGEVCDLKAKGEPDATVERLAGLLRTNDVRLLVCGGDGTVTWLLNEIDRCPALERKKDELPVAIMPLGTGNDLARSLGWGAKLSKVAGIPAYIKMVLEAQEVVLDQWCVALRPHQDLPEEHKLHTAGSHPRRVDDADAEAGFLEELEQALPPPENSPARARKVYVGHFQNYFSVGIDAKIAQKVEYSRTKTACGKWCFRKGCGKVCYVMQALRHAFCNRPVSRTIEPLAVKKAGSTSDEFEPAWSASYSSRTGWCCGCRHNVRQLMMVNINRYAAGQHVQPKKGSVPNPPCPNDDALELMQVANALRSFAIFIGARPQYVTAAEAVAFTMWEGQVLQIDGEAWEFEHGCDVLVRPHRKVRMLRVTPEQNASCCSCQRPNNNDDDDDFW